MGVSLNPSFHSKIVHLTSVHRTFDVRIFHKECKSLRDAGYEVVLVAPHERSEIVEGVRIRAVPKYDSRRARMTRTVRAVLKAALSENADLYHFHDPELIPVGMWLELHGRRVLYDVHEHVPHQILSKSWIAPWFRYSVSAGAAIAERAGVRLFEGVVAATPTIAGRFPKHKTVVVQNFPIVGELHQGCAAPHERRDLAVVYVGVISAQRGAREMVQALSYLPQESNARLIMAGAFSSPDLEEELARMPEWSRVRFLTWQSRSEVASILNRVRAGLVLFHPEPNHLNAQPNKLFEYMSAGIPIVASDFPLWRQIVEGEKCGLLVDPLNPIAIAEAMQWLFDHVKEAEAMGKRGQEAVRTKYNWAVESEKLLAFYQSLLK